MKKIILLVTFLIVLTSYKSINNCENPINSVTYKLGNSMIQNSNSESIPPNIKDDIKQISETQKQMEFKLYFTKDKSIFQIVDKLYNSDNFVTKIALTMVGAIYYKDNIKKEKIKQRESGDNLYNIIHPFDEYHWNVTKETKIISGYKCYKATCVYEEYDIGRKRNLVFNPEVWFAPELPYSFGPIGLDGLPGLVLEGKFSNGLYYYATNISLSIKDKKIKIEKPIKGKFVNDVEYQKIQLELREK